MADWDFLTRLDAQLREAERAFRSMEASGAFRQLQLAASQAAELGSASRVAEEFCRSMGSGAMLELEKATAIGDKIQDVISSLGPGGLSAAAIESLRASSCIPRLTALANTLQTTKIHPSWYTAPDWVAHLQGPLVVEDRLSEVYKALERNYAASSLIAFEQARIAQTVRSIDFPEWDKLVLGFDKMALAREKLATALSASSFGRLEWPRIVTEWPSMGVVSHAELLRALGGEAQVVGPPAEGGPPASGREELLEGIDERLMQLLTDHPHLREEWLAAKEQRRSGGRRSWRYFSLSIRQLLDDVLKMVAPLGVVSEWCRANGQVQPTRRSQLRYVGAVFQNPEFAEYTALDFEEMFAVWHLVAESLHGHDVPSETDLTVAERRMAVWLLGVLTLSKARRAN